MNNKDFGFMSYEFVNIPLPYAYNALEPYIDVKTMHLHHDRHLQTYINNLNTVLKPYPDYQTWSLEKLLVDLKTMPQPIQSPIQKSAGGVFNHFFYFESLTSNYTPPLINTMQLLNAAFGSLEAFTKAFIDSALSVFGSGYAWLVLNKQGKAEIVTTANQDCPLSNGFYLLLNVDVWEHAYYLHYFNDRSAYLNNFMKIINWEVVESRLNKIRN